ncbi:hypothetical protein BHE90_012555 [Fusarium euwallaceae]|uniref:Uncharacterized protein n=1 Tax=Fusarium euwallaceae TaxID=1147111 RepID=A0A430LB98_9HYPO|nr:hypothetical protein BHE90_012555 [Fusarium euwallaceae]
MGRFCRGRNGVQHQLNIVCLCPVRRLVFQPFLLNHDAERLKSPGTMQDSPPRGPLWRLCDRRRPSS